MLSEAQGAKTIITTFLRWYSAPFRVNSAADCEHAAMQGLSTVQSLCASLISAIKNLFFICLFIFLSYSGLNIKVVKTIFSQPQFMSTHPFVHL